MIMLICIKQHLSNICSSIHLKLNNTEAELKKSVAYKKNNLGQEGPQKILKFSCLIASAKFCSVMGVFHHPALVGNYQTL